MKRNYRQLPLKSRPKSKWPIGWVAFILVLVFFVLGFALLQLKSHPIHFNFHLAALTTYKDKMVQTLSPSTYVKSTPKQIEAPKAVLPPAPSIHFEFYENLPAREIALVDAKTHLKKYFILVGNYQHPDQAEKYIKILAKKYMVNLVQVNKAFRIRLGPFNSLDETNLTNERLQSSGYQTHIKIQTVN